MINFGADTLLSNRSITPAGFDASKSTLLSNLTPYSKNDIIYCGSCIVNYMKKFQGQSGALLGGLPAAAAKTLAMPEPTEAFMSFFIREFARMQGSLPAAFKPTDEEINCMKAMWWMEGEYLKTNDFDKIGWNADHRIYVPTQGQQNQTNVNLAKTNSSTDSDSTDADPFYKQTWFVALGSLIGLTAVGYIGYNMFRPASQQ